MTKLIETPEMIKKRKARQAALAAVLGAILALVCHALPDEYQSPCRVVVHICTGQH